MGAPWTTHFSIMCAYLLLLAIAAAVEATQSPCQLVGGNGLSEQTYPDPAVHNYLNHAETASNLPCATTLEAVQVSASGDNGHKAVATAKTAVMKTAKKAVKKAKEAKKASKKAKK